MKYLLTLIYIFFTTSGIFLMKSGGDSLSLSIKDNVSFKIGYLTLLGFVCYLASFLLWQKLIASYDLSYIVPLTTAIVQVIVILLGAFFFKESINLYNWLGIVLVIAGVILISIRK